MSDIWYYGDGGKSVGPLSLADLAKVLSSRGTSAKDVLVWRSGFEQWQRAEIVPELVALVSSPPQPPLLPSTSPPPPLPLPTNFSSERPLVPATLKKEEDPKQYREVRAAVGRRGRNTIVAIVLSAVVLISWQYFYNVPAMEKQRAAQLAQGQTANKPEQQESQAAAGRSSGVPVPRRDIIIASVPRVKIDSPRLNGSIFLKGARIDDVTLVKYREASDPLSPAIVLLSPTGTDTPLYAEFGWIAAGGLTLKIPDETTIWQQDGTGSLTPGTPVTLKYDNGEGLTFRRTISMDDRYLFTVRDEVTNVGNAPTTLYPFALISRHGGPKVVSSYIRFGGLIGYLGDQGLQEYGYKKIDDAKAVNFKVTNGWLGITDTYWATALLPDTDAPLQARFSSNLVGTVRFYQADYLQAPQTIAIGSTGTANARLFAGAKEASVIGINFPGTWLGGYNKELNLNHFDLLIDWGWFYFATKAMFLALDFFSHLTGNFGVALLLLAAIIKLIFVPVTNRSYRSIMKMQQLQPEIDAIRDRADNGEQAKKEIIGLYNRENVTTPSGCLPIIFQVLLFFFLYKILYVTIEAHSPFLGWINDLAAPDPSNVFNLFGLLPCDPMTLPIFGRYLHIGAWPVTLGLTVWLLQRRISPILLGPFQRKVYAALPILVAYFFADYMAGLVIFFAFYNFLSILHQALLMKETKGAIGNISEYSAKVLPYGKSQPMIFLMMLAPILQNITIVLVFWRRSKRPKTETVVSA
jgi:YidC/Oxa1 family membrane protein insertase